jgi:hypothetical protein
LVGVVRNDGVQGRVGSLGIVPGIDPGGVFHVVGRQIREQRLDLVDGIFVAFAGEVGHAALFVVGHGAAQGLEGNLFTGNGFDDLRSGDEHVAGVFDHEDIVGHGRTE